MKKNALKYLVDALLLIDISSVSVVGILLGFVIPRGKRPDEDKFFLGLHRHEWGDIHLCLSLLLLALLVLHIWLNWHWVVQLSQRLFGSRWKRNLILLSLSWLPLLFLCWLLALL